MRPGRFARSATATLVVVAAFGATAHDEARTIATVDAAVSTGDRAVFQPLAAPLRILDTRRPGQGPALASGATRTIPVAGAHGIPADATAVVMNVTVVLPTASGYLTVFPAGPSRPVVSSLNFAARQTIPNLVTVKPGTGGQVSFFNSSGTSHLLADVAGYYVGHDHDDRYLPAADAQARTASNAFSCPVGQVLRSVAADGAPTCAADQAGPAYEPGFGVAIDGTVISAEQGRSAAGAFTCPAGQYLRVVAPNGAPTCGTDQVGPSYTAGAGLTLAGTQFSSAAGPTVVPVRGDGTPEANGAALRAAVAGAPGSAAKPYVVVASPGTFALGSTQLVLPSYVSLVGSGREQTLLTGAFVGGSTALVQLGHQSLLAHLSVTNATTTGSALVTAAVIVYGVPARIVDVAARATETAGNAYGIVVFSGGNAVIEDSVASGQTTTGGFAYGVYVVSSATAQVYGTHVSAAGPGTSQALGVATSSNAEFVHGSASGPTALAMGAGTSLRVAYSKVVGARAGTPTCLGVYDASFAPVTC